MLYTIKPEIRNSPQILLCQQKNMQTTEASVYLGQVGESRVAHCDLTDAITEGHPSSSAFLETVTRIMSWMSWDVIVLIPTWPPVEKSCASNGGLVFGRCFSCKVFWIKDVRLLPLIFWHHRCRGRHLRIADMLSTPLFHVCPWCEKPTPAGSLKDAHPEFVLDCLTVNIQYRSWKTGQDFLAINSLRQPLHSAGHAITGSTLRLTNKNQQIV